MKYLFIILSLFAAASSSAKESAIRKAPNFTLKSTIGENVRLSEQIGNVVVLNFWATWCGPCRDEMASLGEFHDKYRKMGLTILGVIMNKDSRKPMGFIDKMDLDYINVFDLENKVAELYDVEKIPTTIIIDRDGVVRHTHVDYKGAYKNIYENEIRELLKE